MSRASGRCGISVIQSVSYLLYIVLQGLEPFWWIYSHKIPFHCCNNQNCNVIVVCVLQPKVVVSANCGIEPGRIIDYKALLDKALDLAVYKPSTTLIYNRTSHEQVWCHHGNCC